MHIEKIHLAHFRNYENITVSFDQRVNLIRGENAQGKTNLLEALYFLCTGRSFRTLHLNDFIPYNKPFFHLEIQFVKDGVQQTLKASFDGQVRKLIYNDTAFSSFSSQIGLLPIVIITPQDLNLITGTPSERRRFLDLHLAQCDPVFVHHLARYHKAVKQRNALLKQKTETGLDAWEKAMALSMAYILQKRKEGLKALLPLAQRYLQELTEGKDLLDIIYNSTVSAECPLEPEPLFRELQKSRRRELFYRATLVGPHRDDLHIQLHGKMAKSFASEGQKRGIVTALRLAEWQRLKEVCGYSPLLGIDDFGIHLDAARYALIQQRMQGLGQVFLTTPNLPDPSFCSDSTILIDKGLVLSPS